MPAATDTLRLSAMPFIGIFTFRSAFISSSAVKPVDSGPRSKRYGFSPIKIRVIRVRFGICTDGDNTAGRDTTQ